MCIGTEGFYRDLQKQRVACPVMSAQYSHGRRTPIRNGGVARASKSQPSVVPTLRLGSSPNLRKTERERKKTDRIEVNSRRENQVNQLNGNDAPPYGGQPCHQILR